MSVDFEAIAQRGHCDVSSLRLALPLLEQGYAPPFLARYRRDELGGLDESTLWSLSAAMQTERQVAHRRDELHQAWEQTTLRDPAIGHAIKKSNSPRMLARLGRRLKSEAGGEASDATRLAVRVLNPSKGDGNDFAAIATQVDGITDTGAAVAALDAALAKRLAGDPRIIAAAVRWLVKNARIHISSISDPHTGGEDAGHAAEQPSEPAGKPKDKPHQAVAPPQAEAAQPAAAAAVTEAVAATEAVAVTETPALPEIESQTPTPPEPTQAPSETQAETAPQAAAEPKPEPVVSEPSPAPAASETSPPETSSEAGEPAADVTAATVPQPGAPDSGLDQQASAGVSVDTKAEVKKEPQPPKPKSQAKAAKKQKKVSPRQRRRRWLVGVLKPLEGKRFSCDKLSSFQIVMLGRALRSQVAQCSFQYDATKLVGELQRVAAGINRHIDQQLRQLVQDNEASIREAAETAWWDDLHERASSRLVTITADHLRRHVNRGAVDAKVVMAIDAIGPRTAATSIVSADGRLLHNEDLPCQLSSSLRSQAVARMGELIHHYHVDLLIISNGPARRASMIALSDLIAQSPEQSVRWTVADRSGADAYASSAVANEEMRSTPRRFRAAAWLAFSVLQPAQALAKVDPLKLRLSSFQRELSDDAMRNSLEDVMISGASRGGVDVNSAPVFWLARLPGVTTKVAEAIDATRRESLFQSRETLIGLEQWENTVQSRQAIPFLRVFGSQEVLDGTLIHPEDYPLAQKLASTLDIELPPDAPPGYTPPDFASATQSAEPTRLTEVEKEPEKADVKDFSSAADQAPEFSVDEGAGSTAESTEPAGDAAITQTIPKEPEVTPEADATGEAAAEGASDTAKDVDVPDEPPASTDRGEAAAEGESAQLPSPPQDSTADSESASTDSGAATQPSLSIKVDIPDPIKRPRPDKAKIDKCIKEWQIGARRAHQLVQWLCDPFGDSDSTGSPPAVLNTMPSIKTLKPGEMVIGVVVGVMPFGVFVELAPDCSGLIHVSRVSDSYIEDLHEAVQVGDVVTAWVTGIDDKRRRVALSAVSPQRQEELEEIRRHREDHSRRGGHRRGGTGDRGPVRGQPRGAETRGGPGGQGQQAARGTGTGRSKDQGRGRDQGRGGRSREAGRGRDRAGGQRREKKPESYRVVSKKEAKPISDAMQKGEEPLRSFGDLMQFFDKSKNAPETEKPQPQQPATADEASATSSQPAVTPQSQADDQSGVAENREQPSTPPTPQADEMKPPQLDETKPPQADETKPPQADETKPPQADETKPPQADETKPPQADETKPGHQNEQAVADEPAPDSSSPADASTS